MQNHLAGLGREMGSNVTIISTPQLILVHLIDINALSPLPGNYHRTSPLS